MTINLNLSAANPPLELLKGSLVIAKSGDTVSVSGGSGLSGKVLEAGDTVTGGTFS